MASFFKNPPDAPGAFPVASRVRFAKCSEKGTDLLPVRMISFRTNEMSSNAQFPGQPRPQWARFVILAPSGALSMEQLSVSEQAVRRHFVSQNGCAGRIAEGVALPVCRRKLALFSLSLLCSVI